MKSIGYRGLARHMGEDIGFYGQFTELRFGGLWLGGPKWSLGYYVRVRENGETLCMPVIDGDEIELWYGGGLEARKVKL